MSHLSTPPKKSPNASPPRGDEASEGPVVTRVATALSVIIHSTAAQDRIISQLLCAGAHQQHDDINNSGNTSVSSKRDLAFQRLKEVVAQSYHEQLIESVLALEEENRDAKAHAERAQLVEQSSRESKADASARVRELERLVERQRRVLDDDRAVLISLHEQWDAAQERDASLMSELQEQCRGLETQVDFAMAEKSDVDAQLSRAAMRTASDEEQIAQLGKALQRQFRAADSQAVADDAPSNAAKSDLARLQRMLAAKEQRLAALEAGAEQSAKDYAAAQEQIKKLTRRARQLQQQQCGAEAADSSAILDAKRQSAENASAVEQIAKLREENVALRSKLSSAQGEGSKHRDQAIAGKTEVGALSKQLSGQQDKLKQLQQLLDSAQSRAVGSERKHAKLQATCEREQLEAKARQQREDGDKKTLQTQVAQYQSLLGRLADDYDALFQREVFARVAADEYAHRLALYQLWSERAQLMRGDLFSGVLVLTKHEAACRRLVLEATIRSLRRNVGERNDAIHELLGYFSPAAAADAAASGVVNSLLLEPLLEGRAQREEEEEDGGGGEWLV